MLQGIFELCHAVQFFSTHNFQNIYKNKNLKLFAVHRCKPWTTYHLPFIYSETPIQRGKKKSFLFS